jgi:hypothetical protein
VTLSNVMVTGKLRDTETVMGSLEGGSWKSASNGNSLATYPTATTVSDGRERLVITSLDPTNLCLFRAGSVNRIQPGNADPEAPASGNPYILQTIFLPIFIRT